MNSTQKKCTVFIFIKKEVEEMEIKIMQLKDIKPAEYNPRIKLTELDFEYQSLKASIDEFGIVVPLIVNKRTGTLISGQQRLNILLKNGVEQTEVVIVDMELEKEKALCIAMNKVEGQWDYGNLTDILEELKNSAFDMTTTGFSDYEMAELLGEFDEIEELPEIENVDKKENEKDGVVCIIGEYKFRITDEIFKNMIADIREKVGFSKKW